MQLTVAAESDVDPAVACAADAFADDPITGYLLSRGAGYRERLMQFFSLLMRARVALNMPVIIARDAAEIRGLVMGYSTERPAWPGTLAAEWDEFERAIPGLTGRMAVYDEIAEFGKPATPHYYLGVIAAAPSMQGRGIGKRLMNAFSDRSASDDLSSGVYLETANPSNVAFYEGCGFTVTHTGSMGDATLWCLFLRHDRRHRTGHSAESQ